MRQDLSHPQQVVQACHASLEAARRFLPPSRDHPNVIVLGLPDESALRHCLQELTSLNVRLHSFREPDLGDQLTAIATELIPRTHKRLFRKYRLLGSAG